MFDKNDKALLTTRKIAIVVLWICVVGVLVAAIIMAVEDPIFLLIWPAGWFVCWIMWVAIRLRFSYLCDIKLIRNKLYNVDNDNLKVFLEAKLFPAQLEALRRAAEESSRNAERLKTPHSGGITEEGDNSETGTASQSAQPVQTAAGSIDEEKLARLKQLLDSGVLTEEEYLKEIAKLTK